MSTKSSPSKAAATAAKPAVASKPAAASTASAAAQRAIPAKPTTEAQRIEQRTSRLILLSFVAFFVYAGIAWYATSTVTRHALPPITELDSSLQSVQRRSLVLHTVHLHLIQDMKAPLDTSKHLDFTTGMERELNSALSNSPRLTSFKEHLLDPTQPLLYTHEDVNMPLELLGKLMQQQQYQPGEHPTQTLASFDSALLAWQQQPKLVSIDAKTPTTKATDDKNKSQSPLLPELRLYIIDSLQGATLPAELANRWILGRHRHAFFLRIEPQAASTSQPHSAQQLETLLHTVLSLHMRPSEALDTLKPKSSASAAALDVIKDSQLQWTPSPFHRLSFTLLTARPEPTIYTWQFASLQKRYLQPMIDKLRTITNLTIDSQMSQHAQLTPQTVHQQQQSPNRNASDNSTTRHFVTTHSLRHFVGNTAWLTASPLVETSIECLIYVPPADQRPLFVVQSDTDQVAVQNNDSSSDAANAATSFIVPRWGQVVILNQLPKTKFDPKQKKNATLPLPLPLELQLDADSMHNTMQQAVMQLRVMLGLHSDNIMSEQLIPSRDAELTPQVPSRVDALADWEVDALHSHRHRYAMQQTRQTLHALYDLLHEFQHMPVEKHIAQLIESSLSEVKLSARSAQHTAVSYKQKIGQGVKSDWTTALSHAWRAHASARKAFFDPTMVPLLYFPQEHLYAVYAPLFLPISIPIFVALAQRLKKWRESVQPAKIKAQ